MAKYECKIFSGTPANSREIEKDVNGWLSGHTDKVDILKVTATSTANEALLIIIYRTS